MVCSINPNSQLVFSVRFLTKTGNQVLTSSRARRWAVVGGFGGKKNRKRGVTGKTKWCVRHVL